MDDASFEDGAYADRPLRIAAAAEDDLQVVSALMQDAVGTVREISWMPRRRRFVVLVNRFRWEDQEAAGRQKRPSERVRCALVVDGALKVRGRGIDPRDPETVFSMLAIAFEPGEDAAGTLTLQLAGDGDLALDVECIDLRLVDLTKSWVAKGAPSHELE